jgi:ribonuclease BN (tRNA processing enzyme)
MKSQQSAGLNAYRFSRFEKADIEYRGQTLMKIQFLGVGDQFSVHDQYQSNMVITAGSGAKILVDCGGDVKYSLMECKINPTDIDAVYISHLHADHIGGLEWLALSTYFGRENKRLKLFCEEKLQSKLWDNALQGGLECLGNKYMELSDYFDCHPVAEAGGFGWQDIHFELVKMPHVMGEECNMYSYGLLAVTADKKKSLFISTDTQFQPDLIENIAERASLIFHDCETSAVKSTVHAHYEQLLTLPASVKNKMWLYHYQRDPKYRPHQDGFLGFVLKGQEFTLTDIA